MSINLAEVVDRFTGWDTALVDDVEIPGVYDLNFTRENVMAGMGRTFQCAGVSESVREATLWGQGSVRGRVVMNERIRICTSLGETVGPFQITSIQPFPSGECLLSLKDVA